jgi:hypothetical protein
MNHAVLGEYERFEYLARGLFAAKKAELDTERADVESKQDPAPLTSRRPKDHFLEGLRRFAMKATEKPPLQCSFCGKTADQVQFLLAGGGAPPTVYICGGCVDISSDIIEKTKASGNAPAAP